MIQHLPEAVTVLREGLHVHCNQAYASLFGVADPAELLGRSLGETLDPDLAADLALRLRNMGEAGSGPWSQEIEWTHPDGAKGLLGLKASPFRQGNTIYLTLTLRDLRKGARPVPAPEGHEPWWQHLGRTSLVGVGLLGAEGAVLAANEGLCALVGLAQGEVVGMAWGDLVPGQNPADLLAWVNQHPGADSRGGPTEARFMCPDGRVLPVLVDFSPLRQPDGSADRLMVLVQDRSESQRYRGQLRETEDRYQRLFHEMSEGYALHEIICDGEGRPTDYRFLEVNPAWERYTGLTSAQVVGRTAQEILPNLEAYWVETYGRVALTGLSARFDRYSGETNRHFSVFAQCPRKGLFSVVLLDISELKKQEAQTALLLAAVEQSPASIVITDESGGIEYVNQKFTDLTGYSREEALGQNPRILKTSVQGPEVYEDLWRTLRSGQAWKGEFCNRKKTGEHYWEAARISPIMNADRITHFLAVKEDITEYRALQESQARLAETVDHAVEVMVIADLHGHLSYANQTFTQVTGQANADWMGRSVLDLLPEAGRDDQVAPILAGLREGRHWEGKLRIRRADGSPCILSGTVAMIQTEGREPYFTCVFRDVSTELELERSLRQLEKMDALGALASGVAHDFNNVFTAIMSSAELIEFQLPEDSPVRSKLSVIMQAVHRAKDLNRRILTFSQPAEDRRVPFDLSAVVRECVQLLKGTAPGGVDILSQVTSSVWTLGDPAQIQQVVMNLAVNALQALDGRGVLELGLSELDSAEEARSPLPKPGHAALLTVRDSGCGMDAQTLERVFEPFFTTKAPSEGTGLGLSVVHGLVTQHEGRISIASEPGQGTLVKVYLPSTLGHGSGAEAHPKVETGGNEHILVVDLEEVRLALSKEALQHFGYRVTAKSDPYAALDAFKEHPAIYDLVLIEYSRGSLTAEELARRVRKLRPGIPIVQASGSRAKPDLETPFDEVLAKPFSIQDLGQTLRKALEVRQPVVRAGVKPSPAVDKAYLGGVLLVEDSPVTLNLLRSWLLKDGYRVVEARDGQEAWDIFGEQGPAAFSLVLSDIVMPRMDGIRLVERIREVDPDIPVVLLSSFEDSQAMKSALHLQVSEFLAKPFSSSALLSCVERLLSNENARHRSAETAQAVRMAQRALVATPEKDLPIYSVHQSLTDAGGDVFRCFNQPDGSILFILADVAGHSVMSSYAVAAFLGLLSSLVTRTTDLAALAGHLNRGIQAGPFSEIPVCALLGHWNPRAGRLHILNAGLPYGLCGGSTRRIRIPLNGTPLGVFEEPALEEKVLMLEAGERVLFATDGFFDARSRDGEVLEDLALDLWCDLRDTPIQEAVSILAGIAQTLEDDGLKDDLLAVGFEQPALEAGPLRLTIPSDAVAIDEAILELKAFLAKAPRSIPLTNSRRFDILTSAREALTNAMDHGNGGVHARQIRLQAYWEEAAPAFHLDVVDEGQGFDLAALEVPTDALSERGRGLPYIRNYASRVEMVGGELSITFTWEA